MFGRKKQKANDIVTYVKVRVDEIADKTWNKLKFGFEIMQERDTLDEQLKLELQENELLREEILRVYERNDKIIEYLGKLVDVCSKATPEQLKELKAQIKKLQKENENTFKVKRITPSVPKKGQAIGIKSSAVTSSIMRNKKKEVEE